jgi:anti-sigma factor RsiW
MADCRDLDSLLAPYVDGEAQAADSAAVDAHIRRCPPCRDRLEAEQEVREILVSHRDSLRSSASADLRRRCDASRSVAVPSRPAVRLLRSWVPLSMAATLVLAVAGVFLYGLRGGAEALAAQLALDHVKCFEFATEPTILPSAAALSREWTALRGWAIKFPDSAPGEQLELLEIRRCISTDGLSAHVMYRWRGQPLSVYVLNTEHSRVGPVPQLVERLGQEAIMWSRAGRTYAVVTRGRPLEIEHVAEYVRTTAE